MLDQASPAPDSAPEAGAPRWPAGELRLTVLSGHHCGSTLALSASGDVQIGSGEDADIILMDAGIAETHVIMSCARSKITLSAGDGAVALGSGIDVHTLSPGEAAELALPARFALLNESGWQIEIGVEAVEHQHQPAQSRQSSKRRKTWAQWGVFGLASVLALMVLSTQSLSSLVPDSSEPATKDVVLALVSEPSSSQPPAPSVEAKAPDGPEDALTALLDKIDASDLRGLEIEGLDGVISVSGRITPSEMRKWRPISRWYDARFGSQVPISADINVAEKLFEPPQKPTGIWLGDIPHIVDSQGVRRRVGERTSDGWEIVSISAAELVLQRDERQVSIGF